MKLLSILSILVLSTTLGFTASLEQTSSVMDGAGGRSSGGPYEHISAVGQPGGIQVSSGGAFVHYAGFLQTFSLRPDLDSDGDGLENELDPDNDNDGLSDNQEVSGEAFNPATATDVNNPDSDKDGMTDAAEAGAGTNPRDSGMLLEVVDVDHRSGDAQAVVTWQARGGRSYKVFYFDTPNGTPTLVGAKVATGGSAPWFQTLAELDDLTPDGSRRFYFVEVQP